MAAPGPGLAVGRRSWRSELVLKELDEEAEKGGGGREVGTLKCSHTFFCAQSLNHNWQLVSTFPPLGRPPPSLRPLPPGAAMASPERRLTRSSHPQGPADPASGAGGAGGAAAAAMAASNGGGPASASKPPQRSNGGADASPRVAPPSPVPRADSTAAADALEALMKSGAALGPPRARSGGAAGEAALADQNTFLLGELLARDAALAALRTLLAQEKGLPVDRRNALGHLLAKVLFFFFFLRALWKRREGGASLRIQRRMIEGAHGQLCEPRPARPALRPPYFIPLPVASPRIGCFFLFFWGAA